MTFIPVGTQMVVGNRDLPERVVKGPHHLFLIGKREHGRFNTIPQWVTFTTPDLLTSTHLPVIFQIDCNWQRDLSHLNRTQLQAAVGVTNVQLEALIRKILEIEAKHYASHYPANDLIVTSEKAEPQLAHLRHQRQRLTYCLIDDLKRSLGGLGLVVNQLKLNITLPDRLRQDLEYLWRLQHYQGQIPHLTDLKLAETIGNGQPNINLLMSKPLERTEDQHNAYTSETEMLSHFSPQVNGNGKPKEQKVSNF